MVFVQAAGFHLELLRTAITTVSSPVDLGTRCCRLASLIVKIAMVLFAAVLFLLIFTLLLWVAGNGGSSVCSWTRARDRTKNNETRNSTIETYSYKKPSQ